MREPSFVSERSRSLTDTRGRPCAFRLLQWILRMCSEAYTCDDLENRIRHISNHCVQTASERYGAREAGNELFTGDLARHLAGQLRGEAPAREAVRAAKNPPLCGHPPTSKRR